jgi:hypothetical protein
VIVVEEIVFITASAHRPTRAFIATFRASPAASAGRIVVIIAQFALVVLTLETTAGASGSVWATDNNTITSIEGRIGIASARVIVS